jgi:hypothetical protein
MRLSNASVWKQPIHTLTEEEMADPYLVIDELFDFADLRDARELLWDWLKTTVTGSYHKQLTSTERSALITMFEKIEKLLEAAYVLHQCKKLKDKHAKAQRRRKS